MAEIIKFEGDMFWNHDDTERMVDDPDEHLSDVGCGQVVRFEVASRLPDIYGVQVYDAEKDEYTSRYFTTAAEAEAVIPSIVK